MNEAQISLLLSEIKGELATPPSYPDSILINYIKEGEQDIQNKVSGPIDFLTDLSARSLLKTYVRYSFYGQRDVFKIRYNDEYLDLQIRYIDV